MEYKLKNGLTITTQGLRTAEKNRFTESEIADMYGISRYYLWVLRKDKFHFRETRANKNEKTDAERKEKNRLYMQEYRKNKEV